MSSSAPTGGLDAQATPYNYVPTKSVCIIFVVLYSISTLLHIGQATRYKTWWMFPTAVLAGVGEIIGWSGRLWSSFSPGLRDPFLMQITTTIISPTPLVAANFIILGRIINYLGPQFSRFRPRTFTVVFCTFDFVSLAVQGAGGGIASTATTDRGEALGGHIMLGGIVFQLFTIVVYVFCALEFYYRYFHNLPIHPSSHKVKAMEQRIRLISLALGFSTLCLLIRSIYRVIELSDGFSGRIFSTQRYFNVLDGAMVILAIYTVNFLHPGRLLPTKEELKADWDSARTESPLGRHNKEGA